MQFQFRCYRNPQFQAHLREAAMRLADLADFVARIEDAKRTGDLPERTDPAVLAQFYAAVHQGMAVQAINGASATELNAIVDIALAARPMRNPSNGASRNVTPPRPSPLRPSS